MAEFSGFRFSVKSKTGNVNISERENAMCSKCDLCELCAHIKEHARNVYCNSCWIDISSHSSTIKLLKLNVMPMLGEPENV